jgi:hypothetical protein
VSGRGDIQPYDSDHTALVHVLWDAGLKGAEADALASKIMRSKWMRAVRIHAQERPPAAVSEGGS